MRIYILMVCLTFLVNSTLTAESEKPNFVLINIDDLGYADVGAFGSQLNRTPHIDQLAKEGMKLKCMYAAPVCSPSRSALMTGCYPKRVGIPQVLFPAGKTGINSTEFTMAEMFKQNGYITQCVGKWHLGDQPEFMPTKHGFDHYFGLPYSNDMGPAADGIKSNLGEPLPKKGAKNDRGQPPLPLLQDMQCLGRITGKSRFHSQKHIRKSLRISSRRIKRSLSFCIYRILQYISLCIPEKNSRRNHHMDITPTGLKKWTGVWRNPYCTERESTGRKNFCSFHI